MNISVGEAKKATASSIADPPEVHSPGKAVDGVIANADGTYCEGYFHSDFLDYNPWWEIDLDFVYQVIKLSYMWRIGTGTLLKEQDKSSDIEQQAPFANIAIHCLKRERGYKTNGNII